MIPLFRLAGIFLFLALLHLPANRTDAWFEEQARHVFEERWLPMLDSFSLSERFRAVSAFYAFPKWGVPVLRKSLKKYGPRMDSWRKAMLLGVLGTEEDLLQIYGLYRKNPDLERPEVWEGAMERLYWKFRIPPLQELELKNLKLTKIRKVKIGDGYQHSAVNIWFKIVNPSSQHLILKPVFDFWIGHPESPLEKLWFRVKAKSTVNYKIPVMMRLPPGRGKARVDLRILELGSDSILAHRTMFLALEN